jgi:hypothetical protein
MPTPHFMVHDRFQKQVRRYQDLLTSEILRDVCHRITGCGAYTVTFEDAVNYGRLATLEYNGRIHYVSFSEDKVEGRNASFQSFPTALTKYHQEPNRKKGIYFYFLPSAGNVETPYFIFMYRLMRTAGTTFLNDAEHLAHRVTPFRSVQEIISSKNAIRERNRANVSSYVTRDENNTLEIYGKTYGANKYETVLLCLAVSRISKEPVNLYEIAEGGLTALPGPARAVILKIGTVTLVTSTESIEREAYETNDSLRSPAFIYNLFERYGDKKCALCECEIPQLIQGAHIWPVAQIKRATNLSPKRRLAMATDGHNGIWLCNNHHKLFDFSYILIDVYGRTKRLSTLRPSDGDFVSGVTVNRHLPNTFLNGRFVQYLQRRNSLLDESTFSAIE